MSEDELNHVLSKLLLKEEIEGLDQDLIDHISGMLAELDDKADAVDQVLVPFLESVDCPSDLLSQAQHLVSDLLQDGEEVPSSVQVRKLQQGVVSFGAELDKDDQHQADADLWGTSGIKAMHNTLIDAHSDKMSAKDKRKLRKAEAEKARKLLSSAQDEDVDEGGLVRMNMTFNYNDIGSDRKKDVNVKGASVSLDNGTVLMDASDLKFAYQRRYGLIGENGVGKSTLLKHIARGDVEGWPKHLRVLHVRQEVPAHIGDQLSVTNAVLQSDVERITLLEQEKRLFEKLESGGADDANLSLEEKRKKLTENASASEVREMAADLKRLDEIYARLQVLSADSAEARAAMILSGLQFTPEMQVAPLSSLSGGWKMRVALAAALFIEPEILMLDEPTNHLDLEAVLWLESYLVTYKHTLIVVSHDRGFLNEVCTDIIEFKHRKLTYYRGNFDNYVRLRDENIRNAMRQYQAYQEKRAHMMEFIEKFRANAKRATMVQSRIKTVEKMDAEAPETVEIDQVWRFSIPNSEPVGPPIIAVNDVSFDYSLELPDGSKKPKTDYLLQDVNFGVSLTSKIAILGANGKGKTTLLSIVMQKLRPVLGSVSVNANLRIGHFTQHSGDNFDLKLSALENLLHMFPEEDDDLVIRSLLGKFQIQGNDALKPMMLLSGGQKSRVAFAALAHRKPHVLVIDEGSNHLSMEAVDALVEAVRDFKGGVLVVSHDQYFVSNTCTELWVVDDGKVKRFRGDFDEYKKHTAELTTKRVQESVKRIGAVNK